MGMTHVRLAGVKEDILTGAIHTAWRLRVEKNGKSRRKGTKRTDVQQSQMPGKKGRKAKRKKP
jgi:hypothetical protein